MRHGVERVTAKRRKRARHATREAVDYCRCRGEQARLYWTRLTFAGGRLQLTDDGNIRIGRPMCREDVPGHRTRR